MEQIVGTYQIKEVLINNKIVFESDLENWKRELQQKRKEHFYLTFVQNREIKTLENYIKGNDNLEQDAFNIFQFINNNCKKEHI